MISSVVVIVGVSGALLGLPYLDAIAAMVVAWMVAKIGFGLARGAVMELIDTGLDAGQVETIRDSILEIDGVRALHELKTRQMGGRALVDVHIILDDPRVSVSEGHQISETVRARLIREIEDVEDVMVHIDPEDDEVVVPGHHLPLRKDALARATARWRDVEAASRIRRVDLHYLGGRIHLDVELPLADAVDAETVATLRRQLQDALSDDPDIAEVRIVFS